MPTNVEIKAKLHTQKRFEETKQLAQKLSDQPMQVIVQEDTFFPSSSGRLKLRVFSPEAGQLIFYDRADDAGPKQSFYDLADTKEPQKLKSVLTKALGTTGVVAKTRYLYMVGQTRIHLDEVKDLGYFMELEVVLKDSQSAEEGTAIAKDLMQQLQVGEEDLLQGAYMDMLVKPAEAGAEGAAKKQRVD